VPEGGYVTPLGRAVVAQPGTDVTIVAWSRMVPASLEAARTLAAAGPRQHRPRCPEAAAPAHPLLALVT
jgi:pyruvate/2-oxoglutarate/acetoin dehydrogenase E1 component